MTQDWHTLITSLNTYQQDAAAAHGSIPEPGPRPGASEAGIAAAEALTGCYFDPGYRNLLPVFDGWEAFGETLTIFGAQDFGGEHWASANEDGLQVFLSNGPGLTVPSGHVLLLIGASNYTARFIAGVFRADSPGAGAGYYDIASGGSLFFEDFFGWATAAADDARSAIAKDTP